MQSVPIAINVHCEVYSIQHYVIKFVTDLRQTGWWFSLNTPVSSIIKTGRHDIAEILLKVALNTINQTISHQSVLRTFDYFFCYYMTNLIAKLYLKLDVCCILFSFSFFLFFWWYTKHLTPSRRIGSHQGSYFQTTNQRWTY